MTPPEEEDLPKGTRLLDRYSVIDRVASGGMATIHRAIDERFNRVVCVKVLRIETDAGLGAAKDPHAQAVHENFVREAIALSKLQHPNTLRIYDFGYVQSGRRPFQISEFLDHGDLRQLVRDRGALSVGETLAVLERITGAIAEAHEHKILHRDIKPANILFARVGDVLMPKLADFGIARTLLGRTSSAGAGVVSDEARATLGMYSPRWAAPEQLQGLAEGPWSDVFSLALVTVFMLAGSTLYDALRTREAIEERVRTRELLADRLHPLNLPFQVEQVLSHALTQDPTTRVATAPGFFEDLKAAFGAVAMSLPPKLAPARPSSPASVPPPPASGIRLPDPGRPPPFHAGVRAPLPAPVPASARTHRVVEAHEKIELDTKGRGGELVRFRMSVIPDRDRTFRVQVKGLNCFVAKVGKDGSGRPTPAITVAEDGAVDFVSTKREQLGRLALSLGRNARNADESGGSSGDQVFHTAAGDLVVPCIDESLAVAIDFGPDREIIVVCYRA